MSKNGKSKDRKVRLAQRERKRERTIHPDDPKVRRGCTGKLRQYLNKERARRAARAATEKYGVRFDYYRCRFCPGFHLTSEKPIPPSDPIIRPPSGTAITVDPTPRTLEGATIKRMVRRAA